MARGPGAMRRFWDARAREDPFFFVDDAQLYGRPDLERFWAGGEESLERMLEVLGASLAGDEAVVEIGCGVGRMTRAIATRAARVVALDVSGEMLDRARELNPGLEGVEWMLGDGETLRPLPDASADVCISNVVFQHVPDPDVTLGYVREVGRVLRPGGWAALGLSTDPEVHRPLRSAERVLRLLRALTGRGPRGQGAAAWRGSAVPLSVLASTASAAGLVVERVVNPGSQYSGVLLKRSAT